MDAVVAQDSVAGFAQARSCALHHFATVEAPHVKSYVDFTAASEVLERNVLHRSAPQSVGQAGVVNDSPAADIDAVMAIEQTRGDKMGSQRGFFAEAEERVARRKGLLCQLGAACIVCSPVHEEGP